jgi:hypothetical protein
MLPLSLVGKGPAPDVIGVGGRTGCVLAVAAMSSALSAGGSAGRGNRLGAEGGKLN